MEPNTEELVQVSLTLDQAQLLRDNVSLILEVDIMIILQMERPEDISPTDFRDNLQKQLLQVFKIVRNYQDRWVPTESETAANKVVRDLSPKQLNAYKVWFKLMKKIDLVETVTERLKLHGEALERALNDAEMDFGESGAQVNCWVVGEA